MPALSNCSPAATRRTQPALGGSATPTTRWLVLPPRRPPRGFRLIKLKVGADVDADVRRLALAREAIGPDIGLAVDANQAWNVDEAIAWIERLRSAGLAWVEDRTSPDDILGHARSVPPSPPVPVASGEHIHNRVMFKQFLQAEALDVVQIDAARVGGVDENLAILLLAAAFGKPVCPTPAASASASSSSTSPRSTSSPSAARPMAVPSSTSTISTSTSPNPCGSATVVTSLPSARTSAGLRPDTIERYSFRTVESGRHGATSPGCAPS